MERCNFRLASQHSGESINEFLARLKELSIHCDFGTKLNDNLRDQLVCGVADKDTKIALFSETGLTYEKAVKIATMRESAVKNAGGAGRTQDNTTVQHMDSRRQFQGKATGNTPAAATRTTEITATKRVLINLM